jgi:hypothetical protein
METKPNNRPASPVILATASTNSPWRVARFSNNNNTASASFLPHFVHISRSPVLEIPEPLNEDQRTCMNHKIGFEMTNKEKGVLGQD